MHRHAASAILAWLLASVAATTGCQSIVENYTFGAADSGTDSGADSGADSDDATDAVANDDTSVEADTDALSDEDVDDGQADVGADADVDGQNEDADLDGDGDCDGDGDAEPVDTTPNNPECSDKSDCGSAPACKFWTCLASTCVLKQELNGTACEDGFACTKDDTCDAGSCKYKTNTCLCLQDSDCKPQDDACLGTSYCDTSLADPTCKANPCDCRHVLQEGRHRMYQEYLRF